ncbi:hypothetical protein QZH41_002589 [Actinostola sp. cb2023]|nr:hypothetical protein QZH41_002589 [Actinostola sp. cb2023]
MKERKCRRTLASLSRLRMNKEDDERDARGDLSSAIVSSVADEESTENSDTIAKTTPKLARSYSAKETTRQERRKVLKTSRSFSSGIRKENDLRKTIRLSRQLSDLVTYTPSTTFKGLDLEEDESRLEVVSIPESKAYRYTDTKAAQFVKYTRCKLCRIFPAGYRIDSSNPNPQFFWNCGCQLVALNYQSDGRMLQINKGRFLANGNCGYILKPEMMIKGDSKFNPMSSTDIVGVPKNLLKIRVISGQQLPKPKDSILGDRGEGIGHELVGHPVSLFQAPMAVKQNG